MSSFQNSLEFARQQDEQDELRGFRDRFLHPLLDGKQAIYFCGNSLGLQPRSVSQYVQAELEDWASLGVEGHVHSRNPWLYYHHFMEEQVAAIVGAASPK